MEAGLIQLILCLSKMTSLLSLASAGRVSPLDKQTKGFGGVQTMATCMTSMVSTLVCLQ